MDANNLLVSGWLREFMSVVLERRPVERWTVDESA